MNEFVVTPERQRVALEAMWEAESLALTLARLAEDFEASQLFVRGMALRISDLSAVVMAAIGDDAPEALIDARKTLKPVSGESA